MPPPRFPNGTDRGSSEHHQDEGVDKALPRWLKPYVFHGLDLAPAGSGDEWLAECPFCGKHKLYINEVDAGKWQCKVCMKQGNPLEFIRSLWDLSDAGTSDTGPLQKHRNLLFPETPMLWGACRSAISGEWLVPGFNQDRKIIQLYKYPPNRLLYPTPNLDEGTTRMGMFGVSNWDDSKSTVYICEGPWDGMALWEAMRVSKHGADGELAFTGGTTINLLVDANVISVPGCGVFQAVWCELLKGKNVVLMYDNDWPFKHPRTGQDMYPPALSGVKRTSSILHHSTNKPASISYLRWGEDGDGWNLAWKEKGDVRDWLGTGKTATERVKLLDLLLRKVRSVPEAWVAEKVKRREGTDLESIRCSLWPELVQAWRDALKFRQAMNDTLSVMLAVALSTEQIGDQLFLQVIGDAGSGKTRLCDAMLVSKYCHALEHLTGFHSGWVGEDGKDYSLIARINCKTLITPEGDVLMANPKYLEIMSQQRRIFDGSSGASYKNKDEDTHYSNLRTPWIIAGTPSLVNADQSRLGDRFIRVYIDPPSEKEQNDILDHVYFAASREVKRRMNVENNTSMDDKLARAYQLTGGYVDFLRENAERLLEKIDADDDVLRPFCKSAARFTALMRARPEPAGPREADKESPSTEEIPTRLTKQFSRLAFCTAAVMNKPRVDDEVIRRVRKVVLDTSKGRVYDLVRFLYKNGGEADAKTLSVRLNVEENKVTRLLRFLEQNNRMERHLVESKTRTQWRISDQVRRLYEEVHNASAPLS